MDFFYFDYSHTFFLTTYHALLSWSWLRTLDTDIPFRWSDRLASYRAQTVTMWRLMTELVAILVSSQREGFVLIEEQQSNWKPKVYLTNWNVYVLFADFPFEFSINLSSVIMFSIWKWLKFTQWTAPKWFLWLLHVWLRNLMSNH